MYYLWVSILTVVTVVTLPIASPETLLIAVAILNFFAMIVYIPGLIYLNYFKIPRTFPSWTRPSNAGLFFISLSGIVYLVLGIYYLNIKF
jgi:hypothetical protein